MYYSVFSFSTSTIFFYFLIILILYVKLRCVALHVFIFISTSTSTSFSYSSQCLMSLRVVLYRFLPQVSFSRALLCAITCKLYTTCILYHQSYRTIPYPKNSLPSTFDIHTISKPTHTNLFHTNSRNQNQQPNISGTPPHPQVKKKIAPKY